MFPRDLYQFRWSGPLREQRRCSRLTTMAAYGISEVVQYVALLPFATLGDGEQASSGDFAVPAAVAEADLPPLHRRPQGLLRGIVGRLYALVLQKREKPFEVRTQRRRHVMHFAVGIVQVRLRQCEQLLLQGDRFLDKLPPVQRLRIRSEERRVGKECRSR